MSEQLIFKDDKIRMAVTSQRFVAKNISYSIKQIVSVAVYNKENVIPDRYERVRYADGIQFIRYLLITLTLGFFLAAGSSLIWLLAAAISGLIFYWYVRNYPVKRVIPGRIYLTYHLDVMLTNGPMYQFTGESKLVHDLGKALNKALAEGELMSFGLQTLP